MREMEPPNLRNWMNGFSASEFPGPEGAPDPSPASINAATLVPAGEITPAAPAKAGFSLPFNLSNVTGISNLSDLKAMVDRLGGIEGILSTMGKVQKFMSTMQQVAPMIKLFMSKSGKAAAATKDSGSPRRRRRRSSGSRNRRTRRSRTSSGSRTKLSSPAKVKKTT
ncbi:hypothetical protein [Cohnella soli]|uniref:Tyrosine protein kinase n=1 Tax=Cohnella soli TaxID=425005 RepID=A0ABW0HUN9_9BACL